MKWCDFCETPVTCDAAGKCVGVKEKTGVGETLHEVNYRHHEQEKVIEPVWKIIKYLCMLARKDQEDEAAIKQSLRTLYRMGWRESRIYQHLDHDRASGRPALPFEKESR